MKYLAFAFALCASITGLWAAWLWLRASKVEIASGLPVMRPGDYLRAGINLLGSEPSEPAFRGAISEMNNDLMAVMCSLHQSSYLNKRAARWTAVSVGVGGLSAVIGSFG
jgi:hypothetical protein